MHCKKTTKYAKEQDTERIEKNQKERWTITHTETREHLYIKLGGSDRIDNGQFTYNTSVINIAVM